jgi:archaellum component FlaC
MKRCENEVECLKPSLFSCHHCSKLVCLDHLNEHNSLNNIRADELTNEINNLQHHLSNLNTQQSFDDTRNKLSTWKKQMFDNIENVYALHSNEINHLETELNHRLDILKERFKTTMSNLQTELSVLQKNREIPKQVGR